MQFPSWVLKTRGAKQQASARLRYMLYSLALEVSPRPSLHGLAEKTRIAEHSTLSLALKKGALSQKIAESFEDHFGSAVVTAEQLTNPMSIAVPNAKQATCK